MQCKVTTVMVLTATILAAADVSQALTIAQVQQSDAAGGWESPWADSTVDVSGGIVTYVGMPPGKSFSRVVIQDPSFSEWAGIEIKIFGGTLGQDVQMGDRVDLTDVYVDESSATRGTTYLLFSPVDYGSAFAVQSSGHDVAPTVVGPSVLGAGDAAADPAQAERYEGMLLLVENVTIGALNLGSHADNYELIGPGGTCWASDYFNLDRQVSSDYHSLTATGLAYAGVAGVLEQYTKASDAYDYYQVLTRNSGDFVPEPTTVVLLAAGWLVVGHRKKGNR